MGNSIRKIKHNSNNRKRFPFCDLLHRQIELNMYSTSHFVQIQTDKRVCWNEIADLLESKMRTNHYRPDEQFRKEGQYKMCLK